MGLSDLTPEELKEFYHQRQKKAAATRKLNLGDTVFAELGSKGGKVSKKQRARAKRK